MNWWVNTRRGLNRRVWDHLVDLAYHDQVRLLEWLSAAWLFNFCQTFWLQPEIVQRDSYVSFAQLGASFWAGLTTALLLAQLLAVFSRGPLAQPIRFAAMLGSFAFWCAVAVAFSTSGATTTANLAYTFFAISTFFATGYLLWKSTAKA